VAVVLAHDVFRTHFVQPLKGQAESKDAQVAGYTAAAAAAAADYCGDVGSR